MKYLLVISNILGFCASTAYAVMYLKARFVGPYILAVGPSPYKVNYDYWLAPTEWLYFTEYHIEPFFLGIVMIFILFGIVIQVRQLIR